MRRISPLLALIAVFGGLAVFPPEAPGAVTVGSNLSRSPNYPFTCSTGNGTISCTMAQTALEAVSTAPGGLVSPIDGVVVRWRIKTGSPDPMVTVASAKPRVVRGNLGVASGSAENLLALGAGTQQFASRLSIRAGDRFGLDMTITCPCNNTVWPSIPFAYNSSSPSAGTYDYWAPALADGETRAPFFQASDHELLINADIEPDSDLDGFGDESQDLCPTDATKQGACPPPPAAKDVIAPVLSTLSLTNRVFRVDRAGRAARAPRGTVIRFTVSEAASTLFSVQRVVKGRKRKGKCRQRIRKGKRCKLYKAAGRFTVSAVAGVNEKVFSGKIGSRRLRPARYRMSVIATDSAGNRSKRSYVRFAIVK